MLKELLQGRTINHPLHPLAVHLPVGLWVSSFIFDILYMASSNPNFAITSYYCMLIGLIAVLLAVPTGFAEWLSIPVNTKPRRIATTHMIINIGVSIFYLLNLIARYGLENSVPSYVSGGQFIFSLISVVLLGFSGFLGGQLVYNHNIGHRELPQEPTAGETKPETRRVA